jgi:hypothetical protein
MPRKSGSKGEYNQPGRKAGNKRRSPSTRKSAKK